MSTAPTIPNITLELPAPLVLYLINHVTSTPINGITLGDAQYLLNTMVAQYNAQVVGETPPQPKESLAEAN